ncbi:MULTISPECIES: GtrA family protein [Halococcus]|uniref:Family 2 glycosyltransferase n=1 Tax=Halococcus salifodinae DSM 8989 TaxID=1227456 RepID=M0N7N0_9EURY|nr:MULTISPECIES: GtrA family protein [Halococcus]EMA52680.1 family 2 glycosyltransferase [Halococcus salifodinae DSM 8989]
MSVLDSVRERSLFDPQNKRLVKYLLVGVVGIAINQAVFELTIGSVPYVIAGLFGSAVSIFANYIMNDSWTWRENGAAGFGQWLWRGVKYGATRVVGVGIGLVSLFVFVDLLAIDPSLSNILRIGVGVVWGFGASEKWVWASEDSSLSFEKVKRMLSPSGEGKRE